MILSDDEVKERIESPLNLLNRLKSSLSNAAKIGVHSHIPCLPPKSSDIIENLEDKIKNSSARTKAMGIMTSAMDELQRKLPEVQKPEKLAEIAHQMSKIISSQDSSGASSSIHSQIIVYAPQVQNIDNYEIIDINEQ